MFSRFLVFSIVLLSVWNSEGSPAPTQSPTRTPSKSPTTKPTKYPTQNPTRGTRSPSKTPTNAPVLPATVKPTKVPTQTPTRGPSKSPTEKPTKYPTRAPAVLPYPNIWLANPLPTSKGFHVTGAALNDRAGGAVCLAGDVNGDGFDDVIVGAASAGSDAGRAYVVLGTAAGVDLELVGIESSADSTGFTLKGVAGDGLGVSVSTAGDFNGDGFADVIVGARFAQPNGFNSGRAYVWLGKASGLTNVDVSSWVTAADASGFAINGAQNSDNAGASVASAGDFNGDGFDDLLVGSPFATVGVVPKAGRAYVLFGKATGLDNVDLLPLNSGPSALGFAIEGVNDYDYMGCSVSGAGDVNGDSFADVILGTCVNSYVLGKAYVVLGKATGFATLSLTTLTSAATADGFALFGAETSDQFGFSVSSAGDMNGDGFADVVVGAFLGNGQAGRAYVIYGRATGLDNFAVTPLITASSTRGFSFTGAQTSDFVGRAVSSAGDFNNDGFDDLLVGAYAASPFGYTWGGRSYVIFGTSATANVLASDIHAGSWYGFTVAGAHGNTYLGIAVGGSGDYNGDGKSDIVLGASQYYSMTGRAYVLYG